MSISRRKFVVGTTLASLSPLIACDGKTAAPQPTGGAGTPGATPGPTGFAPSVAEFRVVPPGQLRLDFIGLIAFVHPYNSPTWLDVALVRADRAPGLTAHVHIPTLRINRRAYVDDPNYSTFPIASVDQEFVNFRVDDVKITFQTVDHQGNRVAPTDKFTIGKHGGVNDEGVSGCPKPVQTPADRDPWTDFDWVLSSNEIYPKLRAVRDRCKDFSYVTTCLEIRNGRVEDDADLRRDSGRPMYRWIVPTTKKERALKEVVRYRLAGITPVIDFVLISKGGKTDYIRCALDAKDMSGASLGAYAQLVHMPAAGMADAKRSLDDVKAIYWLTDDASETARPADLAKCEVPSTSGINSQYCSTSATSDCGCCPPMVITV